MSKYYSNTLRIISIITLIAFISTQVAWGYEGRSASTHPQKSHLRIRQLADPSSDEAQGSKAAAGGASADTKGTGLISESQMVQEETIASSTGAPMVENAKPEDAHKIAQLWSSFTGASVDRKNILEYEKQIEQFNKKSTGGFNIDDRLWIIVRGDDGQVAGFLCGWGFPLTGEYFLDKICVDRKHQKKQIGSALFRHMLKVANDKTYSRISTDVLDIADKDVFEKWGFVQDHYDRNRYTLALDAKNNNIFAAKPDTTAGAAAGGINGHKVSANAAAVSETALETLPNREFFGQVVLGVKEGRFDESRVAGFLFERFSSLQGEGITEVASHNLIIEDLLEPLAKTGIDLHQVNNLIAARQLGAIDFADEREPAEILLGSRRIDAVTQPVEYLVSTIGGFLSQKRGFFETDITEMDEAAIAAYLLNYFKRLSAEGITDFSRDQLEDEVVVPLKKSGKDLSEILRLLEQGSASARLQPLAEIVGLLRAELDASGIMSGFDFSGMDEARAAQSIMNSLANIERFGSQTERKQLDEMIIDRLIVNNLRPEEITHQLILINARITKQYEDALDYVERLRSCPVDDRVFLVQQAIKVITGDFRLDCPLSKNRGDNSLVTLINLMEERVVVLASVADRRLLSGTEREVASYIFGEFRQIMQDSFAIMPSNKAIEDDYIAPLVERGLNLYEITHEMVLLIGAETKTVEIAKQGIFELRHLRGEARVRKLHQLINRLISEGMPPDWLEVSEDDEEDNLLITVINLIEAQAAIISSSADDDLIREANEAIEQRSFFAQEDAMILLGERMTDNMLPVFFQGEGGNLRLGDQADNFGAMDLIRAGGSMLRSAASTPLGILTGGSFAQSASAADGAAGETIARAEGVANMAGKAKAVRSVSDAEKIRIERFDPSDPPGIVKEAKKQVPLQRRHVAWPYFLKEGSVCFQATLSSSEEVVGVLIANEVNDFVLEDPARNQWDRTLKPKLQFTIYVPEEYRLQGAGSALCDELIKYSAKNGYKLIGYVRLCGNPARGLSNLLVKRGFTAADYEDEYDEYHGDPGEVDWMQINPSTGEAAAGGASAIEQSRRRPYKELLKELSDLGYSISEEKTERESVGEVFTYRIYKEDNDIGLVILSKGEYPGAHILIDGMAPNLPGGRGYGEAVLAYLLTKDDRWKGLSFRCYPAEPSLEKTFDRMKAVFNIESKVTSGGEATYVHGIIPTFGRIGLDNTIQIMKPIGAAGGAAGEAAAGGMKGTVTASAEEVPAKPNSTMVQSESDKLAYPEAIFEVAGQTVFSSDMKKAITGDYDGKVRIWNTQTKRVLQVLQGHKRDNFISIRVAISPDGKMAATADETGIVKLWDVQIGRCLFTRKAHKHHIRSVSFSLDGKKLITRGNSVKIWDIASKKYSAIALKSEVMGNLKIEAISPDGRSVAIGYKDGSVRIYNVRTGKRLQKLEGEEEDEVFSVNFSHDGKGVIAGTHHGIARIWDAVTGKCIMVLPKEGDSARQAVAFSPDGNMAATASWNDVIRFWDLKTGKNVMSLRKHRDVIDHISFSQDGKKLASVSIYDNTAIIWDISRVVSGAVGTVGAAAGGGMNGTPKASEASGVPNSQETRIAARGAEGVANMVGVSKTAPTQTAAAQGANEKLRIRQQRRKIARIAKRALQNAGEIKVLFVCSRNVYRSYYGERILKSIIEENGWQGKVSSISCGLKKYPGISHFDHRRLNVLSDMPNLKYSSHIIIVFNPEHIELVAEGDSRVKNKIFLATELAANKYFGEELPDDKPSYFISNILEASLIPIIARAIEKHDSVVSDSSAVDGAAVEPKAETEQTEIRRKPYKQRAGKYDSPDKVMDAIALSVQLRQPITRNRVFASDQMLYYWAEKFGIYLPRAQRRYTDELEVLFALLERLSRGQRITKAKEIGSALWQASREFKINRGQVEDIYRSLVYDIKLDSSNPAFSEGGALKFLTSKVNNGSSKLEKIAAGYLFSRFAGTNIENPAAGVLVAALNSKDRYTRLAALIAVRQCGAGALPELKRLINTRMLNTQTRANAVRALGLAAKTHGGANKDELLFWLRSGKPEYRIAAIRALGDLSDPASAANIVPLLQMGNEQAIREEAAAALNKIAQRPRAQKEQAAEAQLNVTLVPQYRRGKIRRFTAKFETAEKLLEAIEAPAAQLTQQEKLVCRLALLKGLTDESITMVLNLKRGGEERLNAPQIRYLLNRAVRKIEQHLNASGEAAAGGMNGSIVAVVKDEVKRHGLSPLIEEGLFDIEQVAKKSEFWVREGYADLEGIRRYVDEHLLDWSYDEYKSAITSHAPISESEDRRVRQIKIADKILKDYITYLRDESGIQMPEDYNPLLGKVHFVDSKVMSKGCPNTVAWESYLSDQIFMADNFKNDTELLTYLIHEGLHINSVGAPDYRFDESITELLTWEALMLDGKTWHHKRLFAALPYEYKRYHVLGRGLKRTLGSAIPLAEAYFTGHLKVLPVMPLSCTRAVLGDQYPAGSSEAKKYKSSPLVIIQKRGPKGVPSARRYTKNFRVATQDSPLGNATVVATGREAIFSYLGEAISSLCRSPDNLPIVIILDGIPASLKTTFANGNERLGLPSFREFIERKTGFPAFVLDDEMFVLPRNERTKRRKAIFQNPSLILPQSLMIYDISTMTDCVLNILGMRYMPQDSVKHLYYENLYNSPTRENTYTLDMQIPKKSIVIIVQTCAAQIAYYFRQDISLRVYFCYSEIEEQLVTRVLEREKTKARVEGNYAPEELMQRTLVFEAPAAVIYHPFGIECAQLIIDTTDLNTPVLYKPTPPPLTNPRPVPSQPDSTHDEGTNIAGAGATSAGGMKATANKIAVTTALEKAAEEQDLEKLVIVIGDEALVADLNSHGIEAIEAYSKAHAQSIKNEDKYKSYFVIILNMSAAAKTIQLDGLPVKIEGEVKESLQKLLGYDV